MALKLSNGIPPPAPVAGKKKLEEMDDELLQLTLQLRNQAGTSEKYASFHGDSLIGYHIPKVVGLAQDLKVILGIKNWPVLGRIIGGLIEGKGVDGESAAKIAGSLSDYSKLRQGVIDSSVKDKYDKMLHPPLTYLGDAFQYRTADGKFNSVLHPHLGQAGAPYAKTVPSKTPPLGALPDPGDLFDKLMARKVDRESTSGLSSMLVYHATIIIHDIFRTNDDDKNISDSSSYLDLSPLYGYTPEQVLEVRDTEYGLGLLKPDTFSEDRLLRQPPGVCIMLVMYNRYHNYAAKTLYRINENNRFSVPRKYQGAQLTAVARNFYDPKKSKLSRAEFDDLCQKYDTASREQKGVKELETKLEGLLKSLGITDKQRAEFEAGHRHFSEKTSNLSRKEFDDLCQKYDTTSREQQEVKELETKLKDQLKILDVTDEQRTKFEAGYTAAWKKLDDDLFNTARLITCGMYIQISIHDYLRALMGFHQFNTNFTLDPRTDFDQRKTTRGLGNQVTVEFNLLYRFHCAISLKDEKYTEDLFKAIGVNNPDKMSLPEFLAAIGEYYAKEKAKGKKKPWEVTFGIHDEDTSPETSTEYRRNDITHLFDDKQMIDALTSAMDTPISNFGPCNVPKCLRPVEIMGILQARKWEVGTLNDFRDFFGMPRHETFESVSKNVDVQNALRDLYEHPDKIELYPGIFCESDESMGLDPGPSEASSALWSAIFSDAITLVRSDRFYTTDWNTNSLTSWGMNEVTPDNEICKSSVFHRLIQRAFPGWFEYDSIRFFHPFYTAEQNKKYALEQGYGPEFSSAKPAKPQKPVNLTDAESIGRVLDTHDDTFIHPVLHHGNTLLPGQLKKVLQPHYQKAAYDAALNNQDHHAEYHKSQKALHAYLKDLMRSIVKRESVSMTHATFQIDITRDFAIPVATRYVADFLGFGHVLRTEKNPQGSYSENEIYQHITNCQTFLSYNADETKMLKRAKAFNKSMEFLVNLTVNGNAAFASSWDIRALLGRMHDTPMTRLGSSIAQRLFKWSRDVEQAAMTLLLISLDFAYDCVISFTAVVNRYIQRLREAANNPNKPQDQSPTWLDVQGLAFNEEGEGVLSALVAKTARATVRLPVVRIATRDCTVKISGTETIHILANQAVIMDIHRAAQHAELHPGVSVRSDVLAAKPIYGILGATQTTNFNTFALTQMVKFVAQMRNARPGHDAQGRLKKVFLDWTAEGYSNFMAAGRMWTIRSEVNDLDEGDGNKDIFTDDLLRPATDTYLTPNWDEMVPFPMTWKIRYDGFGASDYSAGGAPLGKLASVVLPDDMPPWYQPSGLSHIGGSFANVSLDIEGKKAKAVDALAPKAAVNEPTGSNGCGLGTAPR